MGVVLLLNCLIWALCTDLALLTRFSASHMAMLAALAASIAACIIACVMLCSAAIFARVFLRLPGVSLPVSSIF